MVPPAVRRLVGVLLLALLVVSTGTLPAGAADVEPTPVPGTLGTVTGITVDRTTGDPIPNSCPSVHRGRTATYVSGQVTCSDATGRWTVTGIPAGAVTIRLSGDATRVAGWVGDTVTQRGARLVRVTAGGGTDVGTVRLGPGGTVSGRVTDSTGRAVSAARVILRAPRGEDMPLDEYYVGWTDADGRYTIRHVTPQRLTTLVVAEHQPYAWQWAGGVSEPRLARTLTVRQGRVTRSDAVLPPEARVTVDFSGLPQGWNEVTAVSRSGFLVGSYVGLEGPSGSVPLTELPAIPLRLRVKTADGRTLWYGGTTESKATVLRLRAGTSTSVTWVLTPAPPAG